MGTTKNALPDFCHAGYSFCHKVLTAVRRAGSSVNLSSEPGCGIRVVECRSTSATTLLTVRRCTAIMFCRKIPEQGNRAEVVLRVLHRYRTAHHLCSVLQPAAQDGAGRGRVSGPAHSPAPGFRCLREAAGNVSLHSTVEGDNVLVSGSMVCSSSLPVPPPVPL